jgi:competence protein ComEC
MQTGIARITRRVGLGAVIVLSLALLLWAPAPAIGTAPSRVAFINVGQGDSALLTDGAGFDVLIDGGLRAAGPTVVAYLRQQGVTDVDVMVASHADADHVGGLIDVLALNDIPVKAVVYNGYAGSTITWSDFAAAVANEGLVLTPAAFPGTFQWGGMTVQVLNPVAGLSNPEQNKASVVLRVQNGTQRFLFPGDIDSTVEATVVARGTPVAADVLKVPHHGSAYGSSAAFLAAVHPHDAVISVGDNSYGHPAPETLARLAASGATLWRTDVDGTVVFTTSFEARFFIFLPLTSR